MTVLVVGSIALDTIETPTTKVEDILGGACTYFAFAARHFTNVRAVSVIGNDFPQEKLDLMKEKGIDVSGVHQVEGKTFRWHGRYKEDMNIRETVSVELGTFENFFPLMPASFNDSEFVFLANGDPRTQARVLDSVKGSKFVLCDTMDLWINIQLDALLGLLKKIDGLFINDDEARMLSGEKNLIRAGKKILGLGPKLVVLKKGEHGAILFFGDSISALPAFPLEEVPDPTGAGDTFAGGMMGFIASQGKTDEGTLKKGMAYGTVMASFAVESFGVDRLLHLDKNEIDERVRAFSHFVTPF